MGEKFKNVMVMWFDNVDTPKSFFNGGGGRWKEIGESMV